MYLLGSLEAANIYDTSTPRPQPGGSHINVFRSVHAAGHIFHRQLHLSIYNVFPLRKFLSLVVCMVEELALWDSSHMTSLPVIMSSLPVTTLFPAGKYLPMENKEK